MSGFAAKAAAGWETCTALCLIQKPVKCNALQAMTKPWAIWLSDVRQMNFLRATQAHAFSLLSAASESWVAAWQGDCRTRLSNKLRD